MNSEPADGVQYEIEDEKGNIETVEAGHKTPQQLLADAAKQLAALKRAGRYIKRLRAWKNRQAQHKEHKAVETTRNRKRAKAASASRARNRH